jgi:ABC-type sulfate transport system substrate-binding protein
MLEATLANKHPSRWSELLEKSDWRRGLAMGLGLALVVIAIYFLASRLFKSAEGPVQLNVYAFSTLEEALTGAVFPAFEQEWENRTGRDLEIQGVFGPSGTLAEQILLGAPADVVLMSNRQHITWLRLARLIDANTEVERISLTPMVIVVREGNPHGLKEFSDLAQPGLRLLHPHPVSSGAGSWGLVAEYGAAYLREGDAEAAKEEVRRIWMNVAWMAPSARAALTLFELGAGDALVTYEQDARLAAAREVPMEIVLPANTALAEHFAATVSMNLSADESPVAEAFIAFLLSAQGQADLRRFQLRPTAQPEAGFPLLISPFWVDDLGGWPQIYADLVEGFWASEIEPSLEMRDGVLTSGAED